MMKWVLAGVLSVGMVGAAMAGDGCGWGSKSACGSKSKADTTASKVEIPTYDTAQVKQAIDSGAQVTIIDARTAKWDDGRRLPGAISVSAESTDEQIAGALPDKAAKIITYCSNEQCPASKNLATRLLELGYTNVSKYPAGIDGWNEAGHEIVDTRAAASGRS